MTHRSLHIFSALALFVPAAAAQSDFPEPTPTPVKVVVTDSMPRTRSFSTPAPKPGPEIETSRSGGPSTPPTAAGGVRDSATERTTAAMSFSQIKSKIAEARRLMQARPLLTASTESLTGNELVRIAFLDSRTRQIDFAVLTKEAFLSTTQDKQTVSQNGRPLLIRTIRGNGVNTPLAITDETGAAQTPIIVQYPVVRNGKYVETAYYVSTHGGLVTSDVVGAGKLYVRNVIEIARERLREKGVSIQPKIADIAERLATVEHVDHQRFKSEYQLNVFNDIFTLYALNEGQTYRYSVSSAGAGGMVQMIPSTYRMIRSMYPNVNLMPDFVEGMQNHVNATQAMLLYMQSTWNDLSSNQAINDAVENKLATQDQLMAAGYNSNPARLAGYIRRGGADWTSLIPEETKIYLQIYSSLERFVPMTPRSR